MYSELPWQVIANLKVCRTLQYKIYDIADFSTKVYSDTEIET